MKKHAVAVLKKKLADFTGKSFLVKVGGTVIEGFVVRKGERYYAYRNLCMHLPITLDLKDEQFFTYDKVHLQCHMHGAIYEIETGRCVEGPCVGASLIPLEVIEEEGRLVITIPDDIESK